MSLTTLNNVSTLSIYGSSNLPCLADVLAPVKTTTRKHDKPPCFRADGWCNNDKVICPTLVLTHYNNMTKCYLYPRVVVFSPCFSMIRKYWAEARQKNFRVLVLLLFYPQALLFCFLVFLAWAQLREQDKAERATIFKATMYNDHSVYVKGLGFSCVYIASATAISQHFSSRKQLFYLSLHAVGPGIGGMIYPYLIRCLSDVYGFRGALLLIGAICMNTVPACILWKRHNNTIKRQNCTEFTNQIDEFQTRFKVKTEGSGDIIMIEKLKDTASAEMSDSVYVSQYPVVHDEMKTKTVIVQAAGEDLAAFSKSKASKNVKQTLSNKVFMTFVMGMTIMFPSVFLILIFVADIYQDSGLSSDDVSLGLLLVNVTSIIGRLLPGIFLQSKRVSPLILPLSNAVFSAVLLFCFLLVKSRWLIITLTCALGISLGIVSSMINVVTLKLVGSETLPTALGMCFTLIGIGQVVSGPVNGYIRDVTGSYTAIFYAAIGVNLVAVVLFFVAHIMRRKETLYIKKRSSVFYLTSF